VLSEHKSIHRCPSCLGQIIIEKTDVYEDDNIIKIIIAGRCSRCDTQYRYEKVINKAKIERKYIYWRPEAKFGDIL